MTSSIMAQAYVFQADGHTQESARQLDNRGRALGQQFVYGKFDGLTDSYDYHNDSDLRAFQDALGSVRRAFVDIHLAPENVEAEEMTRRALARKKKLENKLPKGWQTRSMTSGQEL